jgi:peptidoglycan hydrolase CwlO-like protein
LKKTIITLSMAATVGLGTVFAGIPANNVWASEKLNELNEKSKEIQSQKSGIENQITQTQDQIEKIQTEQNQVEAEMKRIDMEIDDTATKIAEKNQLINAKNDEIAQVKVEIEELIERIETRNELLKDRARSYQEGGGMVSYIDVLVGAQSFGDFIDRVGAVAVIMEADQSILEEHAADKNSLEQKQNQVEKELADLETMRQDLESLKATLDQQKADKNNLMAILEQQVSEAQDTQMSLQEEQSILDAQDAALQTAIGLEQQRQAELEKQQEEAKKQQEEVKKQEAAAADKQSSATSSSNNSSQSSAANTPPVSSGGFTRPTSGYITSGFGSRTLSGGQDFHYGVDIAKSGTVPVVAVAEGVVNYAGPMGTYGNVIMITHSIGGKRYTTVYAHLNSISVSNATTVSKGQMIGYMGNTGNSTGQHLHFELHDGPWIGSRSNAISPFGIVPL